MYVSVLSRRGAMYDCRESSMRCVFSATAAGAAHDIIDPASFVIRRSRIQLLVLFRRR
jgi:hypothetical protein